MNSNQKPTVLLLAGGVGKRFAPLTINKTLLPIFGQPLLTHAFEQLERVGLTQVTVVTNSFNHQFLQSYKTSLHLTLVEQNKPKGMADAVLTAKDQIGGPVLVCNPNDFVADSLLIELLEKIRQNPDKPWVVGKQMDTYFNGGYLRLKNDCVKDMLEKPGEGKQPSDLVKLVFDYFPQFEKFTKLVDQTQSDVDDVYERALAKIMQTQPVGFVAYNDYWQAVKRPDMVLDLVQVLLENRLEAGVSETAEIDPAASIQGKVKIEAGAKVMAGACIVGPAYIGKNVVIGQSTLVRESVIEDSAVIGFGSEVARSYIGPGCKLHHNFVGDSLLESNVNPSFGTVFANWRIDNGEILVDYPSGKVKTGKTKLGSIVATNVFCGVNCAIMPGTIIGANTTLYPQCRVKGLIEANSLIKESTF